MYHLCDNRTEEAYRHIKADDARNITSHPAYPILLYLLFFWFAAFLYTAWSILICSRCSALVLPFYVDRTTLFPQPKGNFPFWSRAAGELDSIHYTFSGARFCFLYNSFFVYHLCDNRAEETYRHIKADNARHITSHPSYHILYLLFFWFAAFLYTAWSILTCSRCSALILPLYVDRTTMFPQPKGNFPFWSRAAGELDSMH